MRIDYDRLILLLLPLRLRAVRIVSMLRVLISPIVLMHDNFHSWADKRRLRAAATPQALMLERLVLSETGLSVQILPVETGASPDFEVKHPDDASSADVEAARSVIDRYKLAGKSYRVAGSVVPFTIAWSDFICSVGEIMAVETHEWTDRVCKVVTESLPVNVVRLTHTGALGDQIYKLVADHPVTSTVSAVIRFEVPSGDFDESFTIQIGDTESGVLRLLQEVTNLVCINGAIPSSDANYEYQILLQ